MRLRVNLIIEYDANPEHYGTSDPQEMARMDMDDGDVAALIQDNETSWTVEVVENG